MKIDKILKASDNRYLPMALVDFNDLANKLNLPTIRNVSGTLPKIKSKIKKPKRKSPPTDQSVIFHYACPSCSAKLQPPTSPSAGQKCLSCGWHS